MHVQSEHWDTVVVCDWQTAVSGGTRKLVLHDLRGIFLYLSSKDIDVLQLSVFLSSVLMVHHQHCNIKKKTFLTNVFMCVHFRSSFFPSGFFSHGHCSSPIITFTKLTCYNMYLRIFTHHTHTNALSFTPNQQQKNLSNKRVAHVGFTKHEYQTIKHEIYSYNHEWQHLQRITQISFCRSRLAIIHEQRIQHIVHT